MTGPRPYLVLTLRRTGGTALMGFLSRVSAFPSVAHEPFNPDRVWGEVTTRFRTDGDRSALAPAIASRLSDRPNIKHCIEITPPALTEALVAACAARDYRIFVLTRADEGARLRSLAIAQATGAWGAQQAQTVYPRILSGQVVPRPADAEALRRLILRDAASLGRTLATLRHAGIAFDWLVFEELYRDRTRIGAEAQRLAGLIGIAVADDDARLAEFAAAGGQRSADIAAHVPGLAEVDAVLRRAGLA